MHIKPGAKVIILEDCRNGAECSVAGQVGTYEGDSPRGVMLVVGGKLKGEYEYSAFMEWYRRHADVCPAVEWKQGEPQPDGDYFMVIDNPRIRTPGGSYIWGDECWWQEAGDVTDLEAAQAALENHKVALRTAMQALAELSTQTGTS